jgi:hypothetical protein
MVSHIRGERVVVEVHRSTAAALSNAGSASPKSEVVFCRTTRLACAESLVHAGAAINSIGLVGQPSLKSVLRTFRAPRDTLTAPSCIRGPGSWRTPPHDRHPPDADRSWTGVPPDQRTCTLTSRRIRDAQILRSRGRVTPSATPTTARHVRDRSDAEGGAAAARLRAIDEAHAPARRASMWCCQAG